MSSINHGRAVTRVATITAGLLLSGAAFSMSPLAQGYMLGADQAMPGMEGKSAKKTGGRFASMDTNKDGAVSREEASAFHAAQFQKMDANKDGRLSQDESMAGMKGMHEGGCCGMNMMGGDGMMKMKGGEGMCGGAK